MAASSNSGNTTSAADQAARLTVLGESAAALVHAISNALNAIGMNAELARLLAERGAAGGAGELSQALQRICDDSRACAGDTRRLVAFARGERHAEEVTVGHIIEQFRESLASILQLRHIEMTTQVSNADVELLVDPMEMQQMLLCLVREGSEAGAGRVSIACACDGTVVEISVAHDGSQADTGATSPASMRRRFIDAVVRTCDATIESRVDADGWPCSTLSFPVR